MSVQPVRMMTETTLPPWDLALYTDEYTRARESPDVKSSERAWHRLLSTRPLLYLPDRSPSGEYDVRLDRHRKSLHRKQLDEFAHEVEHRTAALLQCQHRVLCHWRRSAVVIQAQVRGLLARRRVQRMRQQLMDEALAAARAREFAALQRRRHRAAMRIQCVFHAHCSHLHYVYDCRRRVKNAVALYVFRWRRTRAADRIQRCYRTYRRRQKLWKALKTVMRMLRLSHQRERLDAAAAAFQRARHHARERERQHISHSFPREMAEAKRVIARKKMLFPHHTASSTRTSSLYTGTSLPLVVSPNNKHSSHGITSGQQQRLPPL